MEYGVFPPVIVLLVAMVAGNPLLALPVLAVVAFLYLWFKESLKYGGDITTGFFSATEQLSNTASLRRGAGSATTFALPDFTPKADKKAKKVFIGTTDEGTTVSWLPSIKGNPHLLVLGLPGMGKTTSVISACKDMIDMGITPVVIDYHGDIARGIGGENRIVSLSTGLASNPLDSEGGAAFLDACGAVRDIFAFLYPDLGGRQLSKLLEVLTSLKGRQLSSIMGALEDCEADEGLISRIGELSTYGTLKAGTGGEILSSTEPVIVALHGTDNETIKKAVGAFALYSVYQGMRRRGEQSKITHAIIVDEAHLSGSLTVLDKIAREGRKFGVAVVLASHCMSDFSEGLLASIGNVVALRVGEKDARLLARKFSVDKDVASCAETIRTLEKYHALVSFEASPLTRVKLGRAGGATPPRAKKQLPPQLGYPIPQPSPPEKSRAQSVIGREVKPDVSFAHGRSIARGLGYKKEVSANESIRSDLVSKKEALRLTGLGKTKFHQVLKENPKIKVERIAIGGTVKSFYSKKDIAFLVERAYQGERRIA